MSATLMPSPEGLAALSHTVTLDAGLRIHYYAAGAPAAPALVLIHGLGDEADTWRHILRPLAETHRVIALDLPGFGRSGHPQRAYTLTFFAQTVAQLLRALAVPRATLVGSSLGAAVAQRGGPGPAGSCRASGAERWGASRGGGPAPGRPLVVPHPGGRARSCTPACAAPRMSHMPPCGPTMAISTRSRPPIARSCASACGRGSGVAASGGPSSRRCAGWRSSGCSGRASCAAASPGWRCRRC